MSNSYASVTRSGANASNKNSNKNEGKSSSAEDPGINFEEKMAMMESRIIHQMTAMFQTLMKNEENIVNTL